MRDHHREIIAREAENWRSEPRQPTTERDVYLDHFGPWLTVVLMERSNRNTRVTTAHFDGEEMPLTAAMVRDRFAHPFGRPA